AIVPAITGDLPNRHHGFFVDGFVGVFGDEAAVSLDSGDTALLGEVRGLLGVLDPPGEPLARNGSNGEGAVITIVFFRPGSSNPERGRLNPVSVKRAAEPRDHLGLKGIDPHLARWHSQIVHLPNRAVRVFSHADDQTQSHCFSGSSPQTTSGRRFACHAGIQRRRIPPRDDSRRACSSQSYAQAPRCRRCTNSQKPPALVLSHGECPRHLVPGPLSLVLRPWHLFLRQGSRTPNTTRRRASDKDNRQMTTDY